MKRYLVAATAALVLAGLSASAQEKNQDNNSNRNSNQKKERRQKMSRDGQNNKDKDDDKLDEYDEIIIKRKKGENDSKVTVEIKDDEVFVDGKPIDEYEDDDLSVQKRSANRYRLRGPESPFRFEGGNWMPDGDNIGEDVAFLGVMTEGSSNGAKVQEVTDNSAADKAGLKEGDLITRINDKPVFDHEEVADIVRDLKPGDKVEITYKRDGKENKTTATLGKRKNQAIGRMQPGNPPMVFNFDRDQFEKNFNHDFEQNLNNNFNHQFDYLIDMGNRPRLGIKAQDTEEGNGVKVLEVEEGSAAEKAGIKANDIITSFDGEKVTNAGELVRASRDLKSKSTLKVELTRDGKNQTIEVKIPKKLKTTDL